MGIPVSNAIDTGLWTYLRVGRLLHFIAFCDVLLVVFSIYYLSTGVSGWLYWFMWLNIVMYSCQFALAELDAYSRFQNFKQLRDQMYFNGFKFRILKPMTKSRCQRDAALVACRQMGYENDAKQIYSQMGYQWYHVPPDFVFTHPFFFFSKYFWRTTFFVPYYKPRIHENNVPQMELPWLGQTMGIESTT